MGVSVIDLLKVRNVFTSILPKYDQQYALRPGQIRMAEHVMASFNESKYGLIEAQTGVGKSNAYLAPAILYLDAHPEHKVVVSTGTKVLQDQLLKKSIPYILEALNKEEGIKYAVLKGKQNYLCPYKYERAYVKGAIPKYIYNQCRMHSEVESLKLDSGTMKLIPAMNADDDCMGKACPDYDRCPLTQARRKARQAQLIVTNHHVVMHQIKYPNAGLLPSYNKIIFDEGHNVPSVMSSVFTRTLSEKRFEKLINDTLAHFNFDSVTCHLTDKLEQLSERFFSAIVPENMNTAQETFLIDLEQYDYDVVKEIADVCKRMVMDSTGHPTRLLRLINIDSDDIDELAKKQITRLPDRYLDLANDIKFMSKMHAHFAAWAEVKRDRRNGKIHYVLNYTPLDVGPLFQREFAQTDKSGIITSATMSVNGKASYFKKQLGYDEHSPNVTFTSIETPFDYNKHACVYVPNDLPVGNDKEGGFLPKACQRTTELVQTVQGRTLVLCTSTQAMDAMYQYVSSKVPYTCLKQYDKPNQLLIEEFQKDKHSVLFATKSFWEGVDIPGEALSCVIMDKIPFPTQGDPIVKAMSRFIEKKGINSFKQYNIPEAVILFKQGFGRLIRTEEDKGLIVVLDRRIADGNYADSFIHSMPTNNIVREYDQVEQWLKDSNII